MKTIATSVKLHCRNQLVRSFGSSDFGDFLKTLSTPKGLVKMVNEKKQEKADQAARNSANERRRGIRPTRMTQVTVSSTPKKEKNHHSVNSIRTAQAVTLNKAKNGVYEKYGIKMPVDDNSDDNDDDDNDNYDDDEEFDQREYSDDDDNKVKPINFKEYTAQSLKNEVLRSLSSTMSDPMADPDDDDAVPSHRLHLAGGTAVIDVDEVTDGEIRHWRKQIKEQKSKARYLRKYDLED